MRASVSCCAARLLAKPFDIADLVRAVRTAVDPSPATGDRLVDEGRAAPAS